MPLCAFKLYFLLHSEGGLWRQSSHVSKIVGEAMQRKEITNRENKAHNQVH